jgi:hypothetical protein
MYLVLLIPSKKKFMNKNVMVEIGGAASSGEQRRFLWLPLEAVLSVSTFIS